tara:strand:- start:53 stop:1204 length:1152 start_codon:yes stop_codon:yes gene_type:complete
MQGGGLIAEGGYGCVFHPELNCKGKETKNETYVTKLQRNDFSAENEINIGKIIIKNVPKHSLDAHFAPIVHSCPIHINRLKHVDPKCTVIRKGDTSDFILMKIRYIDSTNLDLFIVENTQGNFILLTLISSFNHLLKSIGMLIDMAVVHNDLKGQNIIYSRDQSLPIIIDFGLSIPMTKITNDNLHIYFYIYAPEYYIWPLEVHYLNMLFHINPDPDEAMLRELAHQYTTKNVALQAFSSQFRKKYERLCLHELKKYMKMSHKERKTKLLKAWVSWDNYSLSIIYLKTIYYIIRSEYGTVLNNAFIIFMTKLLLSNIHPNIEKRKTITETAAIFNKFLYNKKVDKVAVFEEIVERLHKNKGVINQQITLDQGHVDRMSKRISR